LSTLFAEEGKYGFTKQNTGSKHEQRQNAVKFGTWLYITFFNAFSMVLCPHWLLCYCWLIYMYIQGPAEIPDDLAKHL
jgi:hypothetical protein